MNQRLNTLVLPFVVSSCLSATIDDLPLNRYGMIMAHDAASGYLDPSGVIKGEVVDWTKTQSMPTKSAADLLDCGARSFDWRPYVKEGKLNAHHGDIEIEHEFEDSLDEIVNWCKANPSEMVIMHLWDCGSDGSGDCNALVQGVLDGRNLKAVNDCNALVNVTVGEAKALGAMEGGGILLPILPTLGDDGQGCSVANYDESIACWGGRNPFVGRGGEGGQQLDLILDCVERGGVELGKAYKGLREEERAKVEECRGKYPSDEEEGVLKARLKALFTYSCWDDSSTKETPLKQMTNYMDKVSKAGPGDAPFYQMQALWEESTASVVVGELHFSSLVEDEEKSKLNALTRDYIDSGRFPNINYIEVNNVCDGGVELKKSLDAFNENNVNTL
ncbi:hypothetical protein TrCOL_g1011 [Triparma columacea]|uniref:Uncharacterized protein n=1 Tax=Triparma columacea TaxID=722753 RepID=A0A9W7LDZ3_9STRA|nr:hypothetical protein TrCOL_g1011 [Triparma columacea]